MQKIVETRSSLSNTVTERGRGGEGRRVVFQYIIINKSELQQKPRVASSFYTKQTVIGVRRK